MGILGAVIAINVNIVLVTLLHWYSVSRLLGFSMPLTDFLKVGLAIMMTGLGCYLVWNELAVGIALRLIAALSAGMFIYVLNCLWLKLIDRDDLKRLRWLSKKIVK